MALSQNLNLVTARDMLVLLKDWWLEHIQGEDKKYSPYLGAVTVR
jgi:hemerythrin